MDGLRRVAYKDFDGRKSMRLIPADAADSEAERGILVGPPPLDGLDLPLHIEIALNNELFVRDLLTESDIRRRKADAISAVMSACRVDVDRLLAVLATERDE